MSNKFDKLCEEYDSTSENPTILTEDIFKYKKYINSFIDEMQKDGISFDGNTSEILSALYNAILETHIEKKAADWNDKEKAFFYMLFKAKGDNLKSAKKAIDKTDAEITKFKRGY